MDGMLFIKSVVCAEKTSGTILKVVMNISKNAWRSIMKNNPVAKYFNRFCRPSVEEDNRQEMLEKIAYLEAEIETLRQKAPEKVFKRGDRVEVNQHSGFNKGAKGVVEFVEPSGKVWVLRDGAGSEVFFYPEELDLI